MSGKLERAMSSIMAKLEATVAGALGSDGESLCDSPTSPPLLSPASTAAKEARRRGLKFSIDNILRPEFGSPAASDTSSSSCNSALEGKEAEKTESARTPAPPSPAKSLTPPTPITPGAPALWPAWVYCTRYSDRPSSGPRCRKVKRKAPGSGGSGSGGESAKEPAVGPTEEKRPRTAFSPDQLARLKQEFQENRYLTEKRRQELAHQLGLNESQIKIWFQNKRAKMKKQTGFRNPLAFALMSQGHLFKDPASILPPGLYNHATVAVAEEAENANTA